MEPETAPQARDGEAVLIVEDEFAILLVLAEELRDAGYVIFDASDAHNALSVLEFDVRIDLMITDYGLPGGMNGSQLATIALQKRPGIKLIFMSGFDEVTAFSDFGQHDGIVLLSKPFLTEIIPEIVSKVLHP